MGWGHQLSHVLRLGGNADSAPRRVDGELGVRLPVTEAAPGTTLDAASVRCVLPVSGAPHPPSSCRGAVLVGGLAGRICSHPSGSKV